MIRGKAWVNNHAHVLRGKLGVLSNGFLLHQLNRVDYAQYVSGTTRLKLPQAPMRRIPLWVPPLDEQQRIVAEIEKQFTRLDAGVVSLKRIQIALKRYRASVLTSACEGHLVLTQAELARKRNCSYESGEQLLQRILKERRENWNGKGKYKEPAAPQPPSDVDLPEGWVWTGFEQLTDGSKHAIKAGPFGSSLKKSVYTARGFKIYGQEQVIRGDPYFGDYFIPRELFEQLQSCEAKPGDILISLVGTAGKVLILPGDSVPGIINPRLLKLSLNRSGVNSKFIKILLESSTARAFFKLAAHGGTMEILNLGILKAFPVPLAPLDEQTRIVAEVERRLSLIEELEATVNTGLQRATGLRQSILQSAFQAVSFANPRTGQPEYRKKTSELTN
jgi:type I restriction enzyme, S subunit